MDIPALMAFPAAKGIRKWLCSALYVQEADTADWRWIMKATRSPHGE